MSQKEISKQNAKQGLFFSPPHLYSALLLPFCKKINKKKLSLKTMIFLSRCPRLKSNNIQPRRRVLWCLRYYLHQLETHQFNLRSTSDIGDLWLLQFSKQEKNPKKKFAKEIEISFLSSKAFAESFLAPLMFSCLDLRLRWKFNSIQSGCI